MKTPTFADEYIEHWGDVYLRNPHVRARGVLFWAFLIDPQSILEQLKAFEVPFWVGVESDVSYLQLHTGGAA